jgi:SAM-dependent methyltransferase
MNTTSNPHHDATPAEWVRRFACLVAPQARVLDLAAGRGRHARFFAARGARVTAVDRAADALAEVAALPNVTTVTADLEAGAWPFGDTRFDAIVVVHYLHRPLMPRLRAALAPHGTLLYETFAQGNELHGRPSNPDFLLAPGELLRWAGEAPPLTVVAFEQGTVRLPDRSAVVQRLAAVGGARPWPPELCAPAP